MATEPFLSRVLTDLIQGFNQQSLDYALAGGWAFSALVEPRATTDVDLLILLQEPSPEKISIFFHDMFDSVIPHPAPMVFNGVSIWRVVGFRNEKEIIVDLLLAESEFLKQALMRKQTMEFLGMALPIVTIEDLIVLKIMAGRLQDRADLEKIKQSGVQVQVDWDYVRTWQEKLGLKEG